MKRHPFLLAFVCLLAALLVTSLLVPRPKSPPSDQAAHPPASAPVNPLSATKPAPVAETQGDAITPLAVAPTPGFKPGETTSAEATLPKGAVGKLPQTEQESLRAAFGAARRAVTPLNEHEASLPRNAGVRFFAANPGQQLTARFLDGAVRLESGRGGQWQGTLRFAGLPGEAASAPLPAARENRVEYHHADGLTEWYENRAEGIEHGFTVSRRPNSAIQANQLRVDLRLEGLSARPVSDEAGSARHDAVRFHDPESGRPIMGYGKLKVWDTTGRELPARLEAHDSSVTILVADAGATYPVTIDPLIVSEEAKLLPEFGDGAANDQFSFSVALSGDTAVIGSPYDDQAFVNQGSAYVFVRAGGFWSLQQKLIAVDGAPGDFFGARVAIDAGTILIGAWGHDHPSAGANAGAAYVFVRSGTTWSFQQKLLAGTPEANAEFGFSVAISGNTAAVGAVRSNTFRGLDTGVAYTFVRSGGVWTQQAILVGGEVNPGDLFAYSVALDGDTLLVGAPYHDVAFVNQGAAFVFVRNASSWTQQQRLLPHDGEFDAQFGISVELSGNTAVIGAPLDNLGVVADAGSAYVFVRNSTVWSQQQQLSAPPPVATDRFGRSVSVDGDTVIIGANVGSLGRAYVFVRSGALWSLVTKLVASDAESNSGFGNSVAVSGSTALIGTVLDDTGAGADAGSAYLFVRNGTAWSQQALLTAGDSTTGHERFGTSVALAGDTAVVGAPYDDTAAGIDTGSAYVFVRSGAAWGQQAKLTASDAGSGDSFGYSIALSGNTALVGTIYGDKGATVNCGSTYVFVRSGTVWSQQSELTATDAANSDRFGYSVALEGDTALVGAAYDDSGTIWDSGSAYVFTRIGTTWSQQQKLAAPSAWPSDNFGYSVALSGNTALIGAHGEGSGRYSYFHSNRAGGHYHYYDDDSGRAYVFTRSGASWTQQAKLTATDAVSRDSFGYSVSLDGDTAVVGSIRSDVRIRTTQRYDAGAAYVFTRSGTAWGQQAKLTAADAASGDNFGYSVALDGDTVLVGATRGDKGTSRDTGTAYVFSRSGTDWPQQAKLTATDATSYDLFGHSVALDGDTALVGAMYDDTESLVNIGSAYVFRLTYPAHEIHLETPLSAQPLQIGQTLNFGPVPIDGSSSAVPFSIQNQGTDPLAIVSVAVVNGHNAEFVVNTTGLSAGIQPGSWSQFTVTFSPTASGTRTTTLRIVSDDPDESPFDIILTGGGVDLASAPSAVSLSNNSILENQPTTTEVGLLSALDPNPGDSHTFALAAGAGDTHNDWFSVSGNSLRSAISFDFEEQNTYSVRIRAIDASGQFAENVFTIAIVDVDEAPEVISGLGAATAIYGTPMSWLMPTGAFAEPDSGQSLAYSAAGLPPGVVIDPATGNLEGVSGLAGTFTATITATTVETVGQSVSETLTLVVHPTSLTVTANNAARAYGQGNPAFTGTLAGVVPGDNIAASYAAVALPLSSVGAYAITPSLSDPNGKLANYTVASNNGTLTVQAATASIAANAKSKTYGDANPPLDAEVTGQVVGGDAINYSLTTTATPLSNAGAYPITVTLGANPNYAVATADGDLTVKAAMASVTANNKTRVEGADNPQLDAVVTGQIIGGDVINHTLVTTATPASGVGTYPVVVVLGANPNYNIMAADGTLTVITANLLPTNLVLDNSSVPENQPAGTLVGLLAATDANLADTHAFALVAGAGDADNASFAVVGNELRTATSFNHEVKNGYSIRVQATDNGGLSLEKAFSVAVLNVNEPPVALNNSYNLGEDMILSPASALNGVLANDTDVDGDVLTALIVSAPSNGSLTLQADGRFTYTPGANFNGPDTFTYKASDGLLDSDIATVTINVNPVNDAPIVNMQSVVTPEDTALGILLTGSDVDGDRLTFTVRLPPSHGSLSGTAPNLTYTPALNYHGPDSFTFTVNDGTVDSDVAMVALTVTPVNDAPVLGNSLPDSVTGPYGDGFFYAPAVNTFTDADAGQTLTWSAAGMPSGISFDAVTRSFSGASTEAGEFQTTLTATDDGTPPLSAQDSLLFIIEKAPLSVQAENASRAYGQANPILTGTLTGVLPGDNITASYITTATAFSPPDTYSITPSLNDPDGKLANYSVTSNSGTLTVNSVVDPGFNAGVDSFIRSTSVQADGKIVIGGFFNTVGGVTRNRIARLNADGTLDAGFNPAANSVVLSTAVHMDGKIVVAGQFTAMGGVTRNRIARLNADGTLDTGFNPNADSYVLGTALQSDGKILTAGGFTTVGGVARNRIARLNADGTVDAGFNPNVNNDVSSVVVQPDGKILIGGSFSSVGGVGRNRIARLNADGTLDAGFNPNVLGSLNCIALQADGKILIGGSFTSVGGVGRNNIARFDLSGTLDAGFNPNVTGSVASMAVQANGKIIIAGGNLTAVGGTTRNYIARLNADGTLDDAFNPNANTSVASLALQADGQVLVGGNFTTIAGAPHSYFARLLNEPATQTLTVPTSARIEWLRGGTTPETTAATFELSTDGTSWTPVGNGTRITGGWELTGISLPSSGAIRARARTTGGQFNGSSGLFDQQTVFTGLPVPEIAVELGVGTELVDGASNIDFGTVNVGDYFSPPTMTIHSLGNMPLIISAIETSGGNAGDFIVRPFTVPTPLPASLAAAGGEGTFEVVFQPTAGGPRSTTLRIVSNDADESPFEIALAGIGNANLPPANIALNNASVPENQPVVTVVGLLNAVDPNAGDTHAFALVPGAGSGDNALFAISGNELRTAAVFDYEAWNSFSIRVRTTDQGGLSFEKALVVSVLNVNERPVANPQSVITDEDTPVAITLTGTDAENGLMSYAIVGDPTHGTLTGSAPNVIYTPSLNRHGPDSFTFLLSDGELASSVMTVSITVNQVNDVPIVANPIPDQAGEYGSPFTYTLPANTFADPDAGQTLGYSASGMPAGIIFNGAARTFSGTPTVTGNFSITVVAIDDGTPAASMADTFDFVVGKAPLAVTAASAVRSYGVVNPSFTGVLTGAVPGDNITASYSTTATSLSNVGGYLIVPSLHDPNGKLIYYTVTTIDGTLTVNAALATVKANSKSRTYGEDNPALEATVTGAVTGGDPVSYTLATSAAQFSGVGSYPITVALGANPNYSVTTIGGNLTVNPAMLTVTADNQVRIFGEANPIFIGSMNGLQNGDQFTLSFACIATESSPVGAYPIVPSVQDQNGKLANYRVSMNNGALTITAAPLVATIHSPASGFLQTIGSGIQFTGSFTLTGNAGDYSAYWTFSSAAVPHSIIPAAIDGTNIGETIQFPTPGVYLVTLTVEDTTHVTAATDLVGNDLPAYVVIYDPDGGFVTGGGWIWSGPGAFHPELVADAGETGKASFGFLAKYQKGANIPTGNTEFQFKAGNLNFKSSTYEWLTVAGARAQYKGQGTINGAGNYKFMLSAIDGALLGNGQPDRFRMKIWEANTDIVIYDNQAGSADTAGLSDTTIIGGGNIVIHKTK